MELFATTLIAYFEVTLHMSIQIRLNPELMAFIREQAEKEGRSVNNMVNLILKQYAAQKKDAEKK